MSSKSSDSESYAGSAASIAAIEESSEHRVAEELVAAYDPMPLDRALVIQARLSGMLHAQTGELNRLAEQAKERLPEMKIRAQEGKELIKRIQANVAWLQSQVALLNAGASSNLPIEFAAATDRVKRRI